MSFLKSVYNRVNVNSVSTLSGASDVIVVVHEDSTYLCSLFRVRFGKMSVSDSWRIVIEKILSRASGNRMVNIRVNSKPIDQKMRVGSDGEAYFLSEMLMDENGDYMSPALGLSPVSSMINLNEEISMSPPPLEENSTENVSKASGKPYIVWNSLPSITNKQIREDINRRQQLIRNMIISPDGSTHQSDTPPTPETILKSPVWSHRITAKILRRKNYKYAVSLTRGKTLLLHFSVLQHDVGFSSYFNSNPQILGKSECIEVTPYSYALSSGGYYNCVFTAPMDGVISMTWDNSYSYFNKKIVNMEMVVFEGSVPRGVNIDYPTRYGDMRLITVREDGMATLLSLQTHGMTLYAPMNTLETPNVKLRSIDDDDEDNEDDEDDEIEMNQSVSPIHDDLPIPAVMISLCREQYHEGMKEKDLDSIILANRVSFSDIIDNPSLLEHPQVMFFCDRTPIRFEQAACQIIEMAKEADRMNVVSSTTSRDRKPLKSFRLSSDILHTWPLKEGENDISFIADADEKICVKCKLYVIYHNTKIVISDVDGTVTKEDVMGHVMYAIHQDYTQQGIVDMYNRLDENGYLILYLTARAVGQMKDTRLYLEGIEQNGKKMPRGPIICSPNRTFASLIREVVRRKPQEFKIPVLRSINDTFTMKSSPFVGGFGNRPTDEQSYIQAGVNPYNIFIINKKGEIRYKTKEGKVMVTKFSELETVCDKFFPSVSLLKRSNAVDDESKDAVYCVC